MGPCQTKSSRNKQSSSLNAYVPSQSSNSLTIVATTATTLIAVDFDDEFPCSRDLKLIKTPDSLFAQAKSPCHKALFSVLQVDEEQFKNLFNPSYDFVYSGNYASFISRKQNCGYDYYPPIGWESFAISVSHYGDNSDWLTNSKWATAFHFVRSPGQIPSSDGRTTVMKILLEGLRPGPGQCYQDVDAVNGGKVGRGVYFSYQISSCEGYANVFHYEGKKFKLGFLCRINPTAIRIPITKRDYWVVAETRDIRPYKIIIKEFS